MALHMNHIEEVAKILGVELEEEFTIDSSDYNSTIFKLTKNGLIDENEAERPFLLTYLLTGEYTIKRLPWKPRVSESYWFIDETGYAYQEEYANIDIDILRYKIGNCYPTEEDAKANCEKWIAFFKSDEILEV